MCVRGVPCHISQIPHGKRDLLYTVDRAAYILQGRSVFPEYLDYPPIWPRCENFHTSDNVTLGQHLSTLWGLTQALDHVLT